MKRTVIVEYRDSKYNQIFTFDSYYEAWITYYHYKDKIGFGKDFNKVIINVIFK